MPANHPSRIGDTEMLSIQLNNLARLLRVCLRDKSSNGFTLLEMLIALTIMAASFSVLLAIFSQGLSSSRDTEHQMTGRVLAQSLMTELGVSRAIRLGRTSGNTSDGLQWQIDTELYHDVETPEELLLAPVKINVRVTWKGDGRERSVSLATLRLLPKESIP